MITFSVTTQKGGLGKSLINSVVANRLCYQYGYNVLLVDRDLLQTTILTNFKNEAQLLSCIKKKKINYEPLTPSETIWTKEFQKTKDENHSGKINVISYEDIQKNPQLLINAEKQYDFCIYDLPGTLENAKILQDILGFDLVFIPIEPDGKSGAKSIATAAGLDILKKKFTNTGQVNLKASYLFFNKVNPCSKQHKEEMKQLFLVASRKGFSFLTKEDETPLYIDLRVMYQANLTSSLFINTFPWLRYTKLENTIQAITHIVIKTYEQKKA